MTAGYWPPQTSLHQDTGHPENGNICLLLIAWKRCGGQQGCSRPEATGTRFHCRPHLVALGVSRPLFLSKMSVRHLVHAKRFLKFGPTQNVCDHIWSMPSGSGEDQISRTSWCGPNVLGVKCVTDALDRTKCPARAFRTRRDQYLPEALEGWKAPGNPTCHPKQVRYCSHRAYTKQNKPKCHGDSWLRTSSAHTCCVTVYITHPIILFLKFPCV